MAPLGISKYARINSRKESIIGRKKKATRNPNIKYKNAVK